MIRAADPSGQAAPLVAIPSQTVGPFFHFCLTADPSLGRLAGPDATGERLRLEVRVLDGNGDPVPDAMVEIWQANSEGIYPGPPRAAGGTAADAVRPRPAFVSHGRLPTDENGVCVFDTIRPGRVEDAQGRLQASHINVCLFARGLLRQLYTRIYFDGDPVLDEDAAVALVPRERRDTLLARQVSEEPSRWQFDLRLQGDRETVFFDL